MTSAQRSIAPLLLTIALAFAGCQPTDAPPTPSFLVLVIDSLRADHVGAYGYPRNTTPEIDLLARNGVLFENATAQASWTKPSVASLFTSTYTSVHRVHGARRLQQGRSVSDVLSPELDTLAEALRAGGYRTAGFGQNVNLRAKFGFSQGFDDYSMKLDSAEKINRELLAWVDGATATDGPLFAYVHYNDAHAPYRKKPGFSVFGDARPRHVINGGNFDAFREGTLQFSSEDVRRNIDLYDGEIHYVDHHIGRLLEALAERGVADLWVFVTADHGEEFLDHGGFLHGYHVHAETVRVPLVVRGTGGDSGPSGVRIEEPVGLVDVMPTLLELAGLPAPAAAQGTSFAPALSGSDLAGRFEFSQKTLEVYGNFIRESESVQDRRWKLIREPAADVTRLYDLQADPLEAAPVEGERQGVVGALSAQLDAWARANDALYDQLKPGATTTLVPDEEEQLRALGYIDF